MISGTRLASDATFNKIAGKSATIWLHLHKTMGCLPSIRQQGKPEQEPVASKIKERGAKPGGRFEKRKSQWESRYVGVAAPRLDPRTNSTLRKRKRKEESKREKKRKRKGAVHRGSHSRHCSSLSFMQGKSTSRRRMLFPDCATRPFTYI